MADPSPRGPSANVAIQQRSVSAPRFDAAAQRVTGVVLDPATAPNPNSCPPTWWSTPPAAAPGCRSGCRSGDLSAPRGHGRRRHRIRDPPVAHPRRPDRGEGGRGGRVARATCRHGDALLRGRHLGLTTFGVAKVEPPQTFPRCALAERAAAATLAAAHPPGRADRRDRVPPYPTSRWRRYDKLDRYPAGIVPFGDAVVSFNPTYGQGMTMTSLQAGHLRRALSESPERDWLAKLNRATAKTTYPVWTMNAIGDLSSTTPRAGAAVVPTGRRLLRPVPRRRGDRTRSRRMVLAPVQPARQPVHGPVAAARWARGSA